MFRFLRIGVDVSQICMLSEWRGNILFNSWYHRIDQEANVDEFHGKYSVKCFIYTCAGPKSYTALRVPAGGKSIKRAKEIHSKGQRNVKKGSESYALCYNRRLPFQGRKIRGISVRATLPHLVIRLRARIPSQKIDNVPQFRHDGVQALRPCLVKRESAG